MGDRRGSFWVSAVESARSAVASGWDQWARRLGEQLSSLRHKVDDLQMRSPILRILSAEMGAALAPGRLCVASISFGHQARRGAQPVADLAMESDELKQRISVIPIYTVANKHDEFVLVASEGEKQVGLLFMTEQGALDLMKKMKKENPSLGRNSKVVRVMLNDVYDMLTTPHAETEDIIFRFVPDIEQVAKAMEVYQAAGVPTPSITGVPVFQAEGLSIATETARSTPIFLSKDDLDIAFKTAQKKRVERLDSELKKAVEQFDSSAALAREKAESGNEKESKKWKAAAEKAEAKAASARKEMDKITTVSTSPRVEVGSLEEVICSMEGDKRGSWRNVMFIRSGIIAERESKRRGWKRGGKKKRG